MKPRAFLELARQLLLDSANEAALRSCVSRSYYALFNFMAQFINEHVESLTHTASDHEKVYRYFNNCGVEDIKTIASRLNDLRGDRNESDYRLRSSRFKNEKLVSFLFTKASTAFDSFEKITQNSQRCKDIAGAIQKYKEITNS